MSEAAFCKEYVALLEAIRDALVGIDDEPMRMVRAMAEQAIEGDPKGAALDMRTYMKPAPSPPRRVGAGRAAG
jgi:hypothetical protein